MKPRILGLYNRGGGFPTRVFLKPTNNPKKALMEPFIGFRVQGLGFRTATKQATQAVYCGFRIHRPRSPRFRSVLLLRARRSFFGLGLQKVCSCFLNCPGFRVHALSFRGFACASLLCRPFRKSCSCRKISAAVLY